MSEELDRWDFEIAEGMKERKMTGYVYDDKAPNGRPTTGQVGWSPDYESSGKTPDWRNLSNLPTTVIPSMAEIEKLQAQLDRIENLLVTVLGHVEPQEIRPDVVEVLLSKLRGEPQS